VNSVEVSSQSQEPPSSAEIEPFCKKILKTLDINGWELSILLCNDDYISHLNRIYRGKEGPTDVLSFGQIPLSDENRNKSDTIPAGDIVISLDSLERNAHAYGVTKSEELKRLLIHGILHLSGMDHGEFKHSPSEHTGMLELQEKLMVKFSEETIL
jgi:probable rRNA maturation factor